MTQLRVILVTNSDVIDWRIKTVKVCRAMQLKKSAYRWKELAEALCKELRECATTDKDRRIAAKEDMEDLCHKAFELALTLRESTSTMLWGQGEAPSSVPLSDTELIGPYNMRSGGGHLKPVRVLFGPVWKVVDGERMLIKKGEILDGGGVEHLVRSQRR